MNANQLLFFHTPQQFGIYCYPKIKRTGLDFQSKDLKMKFQFGDLKIHYYQFSLTLTDDAGVIPNELWISSFLESFRRTGN